MCQSLKWDFKRKKLCAFLRQQNAIHVDNGQIYTENVKLRVIYMWQNDYIRHTQLMFLQKITQIKIFFSQRKKH